VFVDVDPDGAHASFRPSCTAPREVEVPGDEGVVDDDGA
jgi:hypothetical protein